MKTGQKPWVMTLFFLMAAVETAAIEFTPPPAPLIAPLIAPTYPEDNDHNGIADALETKAATAQARLKAATTSEARSSVERGLAAKIEIQLVFTTRVTQQQIDDFLAAGGEITYMYKSVSYGWNGRIALSKVASLPGLMGTALVHVKESLPARLHLDMATRTGRVRPVWASGFAGNATGFDGDSNITIAIVDTGLDSSHTDFSGRQQYWHDFTSDGNASPIDMGEHGSHVGGIALGSGASGGAAAATLYCTDSGDLTSVPNGSFYPVPLDLPSVSSAYSSTAAWLGGGSTSLYQVYHTKGSAGGWAAISAASSGASPLTEANTLTALSTRAYCPALLSNGGTVTQYVITSSIANYPSAGDGFNKLRGVAPACHWAGAKVFTNAGSGLMSYVDSALDDLVTNRVANNIKVINMSLGVSGVEPGIDATTRQKVNTAVNNGIVVCCSAGNDGTNSTQASRQVDDPGRAAMAITVASSSDSNQLTDYSSEGFTSPGSTSGQEEDYKPDITAPGGAVNYQTDILSVDSNSTDGEGGFSDQQANDYTSMQGTSMASPFAAGCVALIIDAMQQQGVTWDFASSQHARYVKMLLCATATETNANREGGNNNPTLQRASVPGNGYPAGKDMYEGYGLLNPDAAIEAVTQAYVQGESPTDTLGPGVADRRAWARNAALYTGWTFDPSLTTPGGGDFDLYLYSNSPTAYGGPAILVSSTNAGTGTAESISYTPGSNMTVLLVVKRISGSGTFTLASTGDSTGPEVTIGAPSVTVTQGGPVTYTITYADSQSGVSAVTLATEHITLNTTGTASGSVGISGTGNTRTVTISSITGDGTLGISIAAATATDNIGNSAPATGPSATFTVDNTGPTGNVTINSGAAYANSTSVTLDLSYSDGSGSSVAQMQFSNDASTWSVWETVAASASWTLSAGDGTKTVYAHYKDAAGNDSTDTISDTIILDSTPPTVQIGSPSASLTQGGPVTFTVTYADPGGSGIAGIPLASGDVALNKTGTANGTVGVSGTGLSQRTVTVSSITGDGTLGISLAANTASDTAGNNAPAAGPSSTFTADNSGPTVTVNQASGQTDPATAEPVNFRILFNEAINPSTFTSEDVSITGTAGGSPAVVLTSSDNIDWNAAVSGFTAGGTVIASVSAGMCEDVLGNTNAASTSTDNTVTLQLPGTVDAHSSPQPDFVLGSWYDSEEEKVSVLKCKVTDRGGDGLPTLIDRMIISISGTAGHAGQDIAWAELRDASSQISTAASISDAQIVFGATPNSDSVAQLTTVLENTAVEYTVTIYLNTTLLGEHDQTYVFDIAEPGIGVDDGSSSSMAVDSGAITPVTGTIFIMALGISITPDSWNIGPGPLNNVVESGTFTVQNLGNVAQDISIKGGQGANGWTLQSSAGTNAFKVEADSGDDGSYETVVSTSEQPVAANLAVSGTSVFGLRYSAPSGDTFGGGVAQDFTITLKASRYTP